MEIPLPPKLPRKIYDYLLILREAALTNRPTKGANCTVEEVEGKGSPINADPCDPC